MWLPFPPHQIYSLNGSDVLKVVAKFFDCRLRESIRTGGSVNQRALTSILSSLVYLNPLQVLDMEAGVSWINSFLHSKYPMDEKCRMAGHVVRLIASHLDSKHLLNYQTDVHNLIPPFLRFLNLYNLFPNAHSPEHPRIVALHILSTHPIPLDFIRTLIPFLQWVLFPTNALQVHGPALRAFHQLLPRLLSPHARKIPVRDRHLLLKVVGDPLLLTQGPPSNHKLPSCTASRDLILVVIALMKLASSYLWRGHLAYSNFASYETLVSTAAGKRDALQYMSDVEALAWPPDPLQRSTILTYRSLICTYLS